MKRIFNLIFLAMAGFVGHFVEAVEPGQIQSTTQAHNVTTSSSEVALPQVLVWDLEELKQVPASKWLSQSGPIRSLVYSGEPYAGKPTEVFAFYASPSTLTGQASAKKVPGIVLIHGGGGTAFAEWVWLWAERGYAAIAMDLAGSRPRDPTLDANGRPIPNLATQRQTRTRLPQGGPDQGPPEKFESIGGDVSDEWPYHAVANVMRAHSLLRSFPEVDAEKTAVTGISWGGYTTCLVASLDDRFQAAVPVYGCGFLYDGESVQKPSIDNLGEKREAWINTYDPSAVLNRCRVPILFVNGTNDIHYPLDSYKKSYDLVPGQKQLRIEVNMRHSHPAGWAPQEIGLFIDTFCRDGVPLPSLGDVIVEAEGVRMRYTSSLPITEASLHFTEDAGLRSKRTWKSLPAKVLESTVIAPLPPTGANTWFLEVVDARGASVTSSLQLSQAP